MGFLKTLIAISVPFGLLGCADDLEADEAAYTRFVGANQYGYSQDVWLEMRNMFGDWEPVALVFGYGDDFSACEDIRTAVEQNIAREFRCKLAT